MPGSSFMVVVDAEELDRDPVQLTADLDLERSHGGKELLVTARGDPELEGSGEERPRDVVGHLPQHRARAPGTGRELARDPRELLTPLLGEVADRGDDEIVLGREVVQLCATAHAGDLRDERGRRAVETRVDEALDGGLEETLPHGAGALLLRDAHD